VNRLSDFVLGHRRLVCLLWLLVTVAAVPAAAVTTERLSFDFSLPGQAGYETSEEILDRYGNGGSTAPLLVVVTVPPGETVDDREPDVAGVFEAVREQLPRTRVVDYTQTPDAVLLTDDGRSTVGLVFVPAPMGFGPGEAAELTPLLATQAEASGLQVALTGYDLLSEGGQAEEPEVLGETLLAGLAALVVLAFVFASFLALVPLLVAAVSILTTFLAVLGLTVVTDVSFIVQFLISLIGLGVAIDYSLLLVTRWREERAAGQDNDAAVREATRTAGGAVVASGVTVAVSLLALVVLPAPFLRSIGYGGLLIPLISTLVTLTLLPALLAWVGPRVDWPRLRTESSISRPWAAWSRGVVRYRWPVAVGTLAALAALAAPLAFIEIGNARSESLASGGPAYDALQTLEQGGLGTGTLTPIEVLIEGGDPAAVVAALGGVPGVGAVLAPGGPDWSRDGTTLLDVVPEQETVSSSSVEVVDSVWEAVEGLGVVGVSGPGAVITDYTGGIYGSFPLVLTVIVVATFLLLARTFRSVLLPLKAIALNLLSVAATFGATVLIWQEGYGSEQLFGVASTGAITFWLPIIIFAFLFGLSMDYEVFILSRMREEYDATGSTDGAVVEGLGRTGRLVTSAALILFFAFVALASAPLTDIKVLGTALGIGILLDATVVRALLVPALVSLFGRWNWWIPVWLARLLRVEPSPARAVERQDVRPEADTEPVR